MSPGGGSPSAVTAAAPRRSSHLDTSASSASKRFSKAWKRARSRCSPRSPCGGKGRARCSPPWSYGHPGRGGAPAPQGSRQKGTQDPPVPRVSGILFICCFPGEGRCPATPRERDGHKLGEPFPPARSHFLSHLLPPPHPLEGLLQPRITPSQLSPQSTHPTHPTAALLPRLTWSSAVRSPAPGTSEEESFPAPHHGNDGRLSVDSPYG